MNNLPEKPYIQPADKAELPPMNELVCFLDKERGCGPDCMAFSINTPGPDYNEPWGHCLYLASLFRISKHAVIMAQHSEISVRMMHAATADSVRASNAPQVPPFQPPMGKKVEP